MKTYEVEGLGVVHRLFPGDSTDGVLALLNGEAPIAFDTETSGLNVYAADFRLRLCQFGTPDVAYVWEPSDFPDLARLCVTTRPVWYWNADFDTRVLDHCLGIKLEETWENVLDGQILSRLVDPRGEKDGGVGHTMDAQAQARLGLRVKGTAKKAMMEAGKQYKLRSQAAVWANIPTTDETYVRYAGQDVLLTSRLGPHLLSNPAREFWKQGIEDLGMEEVASKQHAVAYCYSCIVRRGWKIDREYANEAIRKYTDEFKSEESKLAGYGIKPTATGNYSTSRAGLLDRFEELGVKFTEHTDAGGIKLDDEVLSQIAAGTIDYYSEEEHQQHHWDRLLASLLEQYDEQTAWEALKAHGPGDPPAPGVAAEIAATVIRAKKAQKIVGTITGYLEAADPNDRVHASLTPLGTQTGRTSCASPNLQNPDKDAEEVRGCFVADSEDEVVVSSDLKAIEWRVAAIVTGDRTMKKVFARGADLHELVAELTWRDKWKDADQKLRDTLRNGGEHAGVKYPSMKVTGLAKLYGSGVDGATRNSGLPRAVIQRTYDAIDKLYPGIREHMRKAYDEIDGPTRVMLRSGRHAVVDKPYKKLNSECQGYAADLLMDFVLRIFEAGLGHTILMLVHDEGLFSFPASEAGALMEKIRGLMQDHIEGVDILTDPKECGYRWRKV